MSLARAFTNRRMRSDNMPQNTPAPYVGRAASQRGPNPKPINRSKISLPVALISTTNMLSYDAPDIAGTSRIVDRKASSAASTTSSAQSSAEESDGGSSNQQSSADNHTDASSVDESFSGSPITNNHKEFFNTSASATIASTPSHKSQRSLTSPIVPQRAASHSKMAHERVSRQRSVQRSNEPSSNVTSPRDSADMFSANFSTEPAMHPFAGELEQLTEIAEEYGSTVRDVEAEADFAVMRAHGLVQFCAAEYMSEIAALSSNFFDEDKRAFEYAGWI